MSKLVRVSNAVSPKTDSAQRAESPVGRSDRLTGLGKVLITVYIVLAVAATARSVFQIIRVFDEAPVAYTLSAVSGVVYIVASIALIKRRGAWRGVAWAALSFELVGVLVVGVLSIAVPEWFGHSSVWSYFGRDYVWIPLVLPVLGLIWLSRSAREASPGAVATNEGGNA